jgi:hypothetical protein
LAGEIDKGTPVAGRFARVAAWPKAVRASLTDPVFILGILAPLAGVVVMLYLVIPTLLPGVASWDTAEFQTVGPVLGTAHPTGYPSYVILGWLASIVFQPFGEPAYTMNLLQAFTAAVAVAAEIGLVQLLTGRKAVALGSGLILGCSFLFWRLSTHADPHMFHVALVAILLVLLVAWDQKRHSLEVAVKAHADRWLVAAAAVYGIAVANHSLALLLPPAIGLFVLAADWRVLLRPKTILACVVALGGTIVLLFSELPIRAAMNAPLVYGHPDTWSGFTYVVLAEQFRGSLSDPLGDLPQKISSSIDLVANYLGPAGILAPVGLLTSLVRRPRFVLLTGLSALVTVVFASSYANADINRYYLVPLLMACAWIGLGAADLVDLAVALVRWGGRKPAEGEAAEAATPASERTPEPESRESSTARRGWLATLASVGPLAAEAVVALALIVGPLGVIPARMAEKGQNTGAVSEATDTYQGTWVRQMLAPAAEGGLPENAVIMGWWSVSTTLWYGQRVLGLRPDITIIDDADRVDDNLGTVQDVFNKYLGNRPLFTIRLEGGGDGMTALEQEFDIQTYTLGSGLTIAQVVGRKG